MNAQMAIVEELRRPWGAGAIVRGEGFRQPQGAGELVGGEGLSPRRGASEIVRCETVTRELGVQFRETSQDLTTRLRP